MEVMGHDSQQEAFFTKKRHIEEYLGFTSCYRNGLPVRQVVECHFGYSGADEHKVHEGEVAEEEVHGHIQPRIQVDEQNYNSVCQESHCKDTHNQRGRHECECE